MNVNEETQRSLNIKVKGAVIFKASTQSYSQNAFQEGKSYSICKIVSSE